jgi:iron(III) transport system substrate-binding protein
MRKLVLLGLLTLGISVLSACTLGTGSDSDRSITLYSDRHYESDQDLFDQFEEETGIKVNVVKASADELITRLEQEGTDTEADVLLIADAGRLHRAKEKDLLSGVDSALLEERIPSIYQDVDNTWFGLTKRARVLVYHPDRVSEEELSTYEALGEEEWMNRVVIRSSTNIYNQSMLASMLALHDEDYVRSFVSSLVENFARRPEGNDRDQAKAVMAGLADVAILNTYYMGKMAFSSDPYEVEVAESLRIFFPNQETTGTHVNVSAIGLTAHSDNKDDAILLMEFLAGEEAQSSFANANYEYPVNENVSAHPLLASWGDFVAQDLSLTMLGVYANDAAILMDEEGWE